MSYALCLLDKVEGFVCSRNLFQQFSKNGLNGPRNVSVFTKVGIFKLCTQMMNVMEIKIS